MASDNSINRFNGEASYLILLMVMLRLIIVRYYN